jgi:hypothetical protein
MISQINDMREMALQAMASGDYVRALDYAERAQFLIATMPSRSSLDDEEIEWNAEAVDKVVVMLKKKVAELRADSAESADGILFSLPGRFVR